jgi:hypothetical protein
MIPYFLLAKLYVKGSLKNTNTGFEFTLKNIIDSSKLIGIGPIIVGDKSYESPEITITVGDKLWKGEEITRQNAVPVRMGNLICVGVIGDKLISGTQKLTVTATTTDTGKIKFDISDTLV